MIDFGYSRTCLVPTHINIIYVLLHIFCIFSLNIFSAYLGNKASPPRTRTKIDGGMPIWVLEYQGEDWGLSPLIVLRSTNKMSALLLPFFSLHPSSSSSSLTLGVHPLSILSIPSSPSPPSSLYSPPPPLSSCITSPSPPLSLLGAAGPPTTPTPPLPFPPPSPSPSFLHSPTPPPLHDPLPTILPTHLPVCLAFL